MKVKIKPCRRKYLEGYYRGCALLGIENSYAPKFVGKLLSGECVDIDGISPLGVIIKDGKFILNKMYVNIVKERTENA